MIKFPDPPLEGPKFALRRLRGRDAPKLARLQHKQRWHGHPPLRFTGAVRQIADAEQARIAGDTVFMAIVSVRGLRRLLKGPKRTAGPFLGAVSLKIIPGGAVGELALAVTPRAERRRIDAGSAMLLISWAFRELGLRKVQARIPPGSRASIDFLTGLGFTAEPPPPHYVLGEKTGQPLAFYGLRAEHRRESGDGPTDATTEGERG